MPQKRVGRAQPVNLTMAPELLEQIDRAAALENRTRSEFIREVVRLYMREKGMVAPGALVRYRNATVAIGREMEIDGRKVRPIATGMPPGASCGFPALPDSVRLANTGRSLAAVYEEIGGERYYLVGRARLEPSGISISTGWFTIPALRQARRKAARPA